MVKKTLERAYGNIPKEPMVWIDLDELFPTRGIRYYLIRLVRFFTR